MIKPVRDDVDVIVGPPQDALGNANSNWLEDHLREGNRENRFNERCHFLGKGAIKARMIATYVSAAL